MAKPNLNSICASLALSLPNSILKTHLCPVIKNKVSKFSQADLYEAIS